MEWKALIPAEDSEETISNNDKNDNAAKKSPKGNIAFLTKLFIEETANSSPLSNYMFYLFCFFSLLITILPTPFLPLGLMSYGIAVRLLPHLPSFQSSHPTNTAFFTAMQHYQFGILYLSIGFHFILQVSKIGGPIHIGNLLFVVWMSDTGALVLGRIIKKRKNHAAKEGNASDHNQNGIFLSFLKSISPGKTLPGLLGAIITGPISALIYPISLSSSTVYVSEEQCDQEATFLATILHLRRHFYHPLSQKIILGLILSLAGIVGDLAESSVKRLSKKKDSGGLLPGHGGVVDRFDSLFVAGVVYYYFMFA